MAKIVGHARRLNAFRALWRAVSAGRRPGSPGIGERFRALPKLLRETVKGTYDGMGRGRLGMIALGLVYIVSPVDVLPEIVLTVLGLGDDVVVAAWLAGTFLDETERYLDWNKRKPVPHLAPQVPPPYPHR